MRSNRIAAAISAAVVVAFVKSAAADEAPGCAAKVTRDNVVGCAVRASLSLRSEQQGTEILEGRRLAVSPLLPSNPTLAVSAGRRTAASGDPSSYNWYATLSQEIEVAGQRGTRRDAIDATITAQEKRALLAKRRAALAAWAAFFEASAAAEERDLAERLTLVASAMAVVARARAGEGFVSLLDADVAEANGLRLARVRFEGERRVSASSATLASLLGLDLSRPIVVQGDLTPLPGVDGLARALPGEAVVMRPEIEAAEAERRAQELRAEAFRRARIPNPTVSVFVQNDGFNERVLGAGIALPIPLPSPIGRTYAGEIAEAEASARRARTDTDRLHREIRLDVATALATYQSRRRELEGFSPERLRRAEESLVLLGEEIKAGRLVVRDALLAQQALVELLQAHLAARRELALASVELARAAGIPLEGGAR